jgi:uncharacterized protein YbjT (DUF2867 family)
MNSSAAAPAADATAPAPAASATHSPAAGIRVIITGATGMVGEGVLHECLHHPAVQAVLIINRKPLGLTHPKLTEVLHGDFFDLTAVESRLRGYNACYFCLGVSSVGMAADEYYRLTYSLTLNFASTVHRLNPDLVFTYVSGAGTDTTEKGRSRWARVKGKTENDLLRLGFPHCYAFRPGFIRPTRGLTRAHSIYRWINWMYPLGRAFFPNGFVTLRELGLAMINITLRRDPSCVVSGTDIIRLAAAL